MIFHLTDLRATTNIALLASFAGLFLPYLVALFANPKWPSWLKAVVSQVIYGAVGVLVAWWLGQLDQAADLAAAIVPIFIVSMTKYHFLDKPSTLTTRIAYKVHRRDFANYPNDQLQKTNASATSPRVVNITVPGAGDPVVVANAIVDKLTLSVPPK